MPEILYKHDQTSHHGGTLLYQEDNGVLDWAGRYSLYDRRLAISSK
jgi:hypothetical protein